MKRKIGDFTLAEIKGICTKGKCSRCPFGRKAPPCSLSSTRCIFGKEYPCAIDVDMEIEIEEEKK